MGVGGQMGGCRDASPSTIPLRSQDFEGSCWVGKGPTQKSLSSVRHLPIQVDIPNNPKSINMWFITVALKPRKQ